MNKIATVTMATFAMLLAFGVTASAASLTTTDPNDVVSALKPILDAIHGGQGFLAAALALVLAVTALRKWGVSRWPALGGDVAGVALTFVGSFGGAAATALAAGTGPSLKLAGAAVAVAFAASGGYTAVRKLIAPALRYLEGKAPAWMRPLLTPALNLLLWAFESKTAVADAKADGAAAVKANPGKGVAAVVGKVTTLGKAP